jgi:hypothetical protein
MNIFISMRVEIYMCTVGSIRGLDGYTFIYMYIYISTLLFIYVLMHVDMYVCIVAANKTW